MNVVTPHVLRRRGRRPTNVSSHSRHVTQPFTHQRRIQHQPSLRCVAVLVQLRLGSRRRRETDEFPEESKDLLIFGHFGEGRVRDPDEELRRGETVGEGVDDGCGSDGGTSGCSEAEEREERSAHSSSRDERGLLE